MWWSSRLHFYFFYKTRCHIFLVIQFSSIIFRHLHTHFHILNSCPLISNLLMFGYIIISCVNLFAVELQVHYYRYLSLDICKNQNCIKVENKYLLDSLPIVCLCFPHCNLTSQFILFFLCFNLSPAVSVKANDNVYCQGQKPWLVYFPWLLLNVYVRFNLV